MTLKDKYFMNLKEELELIKEQLKSDHLDLFSRLELKDRELELKVQLGLISLHSDEDNEDCENCSA